MSSQYRIVVFARNEELTISAALRSIQAGCPAGSDLSVLVLINGCTDRTVEVVKEFATQNGEVRAVTLPIGDKCNAWNTYVHELADDSPCHFFMDGDVQCTPRALEKMQRLLLANANARAIAGYPMSGRNRSFYRRFLRTYHWVFGNLYAVKQQHLAWLRECGLRLPLGLYGNDHFISKVLAARTLNPDQLDRERHIIFDAEAGYMFRSLQPYRPRDWLTYWRRRVTYCLRQLQIPQLDDVPLLELPKTMDETNRGILRRLEADKVGLGVLTRGVRKRLLRMYPQETSGFYDQMLSQSNQYRFLELATNGAIPR